MLSRCDWKAVCSAARHLLLGLNVGAKWLRSKVLIDGINGAEGNAVAATGQTIYRHRFITAHPQPAPAYCGLD